MTEEQLAERTAKRFWVSFVVLLLGLQLVIGAVAINLATGDASSAVIPDYHSAALNWDATHQRRTALARMGWNLIVAPSEIVDGGGGRAIRVTVVDENGGKVDGLEIAVSAYHHAQGNHVTEFDLQPLPQGEYQAIAPLTRPGLWQMDFSFRHDNEQVSVTRTIEL